MQSVSEAAAAYMTADAGDDGGAAAARARADAARKASAAAAAAKKKREEAARAKKAGERDAYEKLTEALEMAQPEAPAAAAAASQSQTQTQTQLPGYSQSQSQLSFGAGAVAAAAEEPADEDEEEDVDGVDVSKYVLNDASDEEEEEDEDEGEDVAAAASNLLFTSAAAAAPQEAAVAASQGSATGKRKAPGDDRPVPPAAGEDAGDDEGTYLDDSAAASAAATAAEKAAAERQRDARKQKQQQQQQKPEAAGGVNYKDSTATHAGSTATAAADKAVFGAPPPPQQQAQAQAAAAVPAAEAEALQVYWLDAREDGYGLLGTGGNSSPGTVYVFGRLKTGPGAHDTVSCCLRVGGLQRQVFFLPRETDAETGEPLPPLAAQQEVSAFCRELGISKRRVAVVQRWYGFEEQGLPRDSRTWLKLSYPPHFRELGVTPQCASDVQRHLRTVTHAFGDGKSFLEAFILKKRLKGPSWLNVAGGSFRRVPKEAQMSHCAVEFEVDTYKAVALAKDWEQRAPPPLRALSLALHTELVDRSGGTGGTGGSNEVFGVSAVFYRDVDVEKPRADGGAAPYRWAAVRPANANPTRPLLPHVVDAEFARRGVTPPALLGSEGQLLAALMAEMAREDPDIIVGHNFLAYDLDVLLHRMAEHRINTWDRLGRMRLRTMPRLQHGVGGGSESTWEERAVLGGRLVADSYLLSKEYHKATSYKLRALALELRLPYGPTSEADVTLAPIASLPDALQDPAGVLEIVLRTDTKALLSFGLVTRLQCLPLTKRLTYLAGNLWTRTLTGSRAERTEYLLLHDFYRQKYVLPDKRRRSAAAGAAAQEGGRRPKYSGGMVLEPERGLYTDYVLLLDFNSLYPSIIQEYKVCFSTVRRDDANAETDEHGTPVVDLSCTQCRTAGGIDDDEYCPHKGILPKAIRRLVQERVRVKKYMATERDAATRGRFDVMQKALKLTANSIYGCLGFESSRFFAQSLAQVVTAQGRLALGDTVKLVNEMPEDLRVIYGDTDSVMLKTSIPNSAPIAEATRMAKCVKEQVNKKYSCLEIDIDGVFRSILLVRKKKYAAVVVNDWAAAANTRDGCGSDFSREVKGLDMVRRDWCRYTSEVQGHTLDFCLSGDDEENVRSSIIAYLKKIGEEVRSSDCDINKFIITKALQKDPQAYLDPSAQPHVSVALRMRRKSKLPVKSGDYVEYIVATAADAQRVLGLEDGAADTKKVSGRAFTKDEIVANKMSIDKEWYLATQFHPPLSRLVEPFRGLESRVVAECLDIENAPGVIHPCGDDADGGGGGGGNSSAEKYLITAAGRRTVAERFFPMELLVHCRGCKREVALDTHQAVLQRLETWDETSPLCQPSAGLLRCGCGAQHDLKRLGNQVIREVRQRQKTYFADPTGYESNYLLENTEASRRVSDRHTRDYVDMVRVLFSLQEWFQLVVGWTQVCKEEQLLKVAGTHVRSEAAGIAAEKVYNLMSDLELVCAHKYRDLIFLFFIFIYFWLGC